MDRRIESMKSNFNHIEKYRFSFGDWQSKKGDDFGCFRVPGKKKPFQLNVIMAPSDSKWEHVSVSCINRCPTWNEMSVIKDLFWDKDETVWQYHPPESEYVNQHQFCLHLWKLKDFKMPVPNSIMVGEK